MSGFHTEDEEPTAAFGEITWTRQPSQDEERVWTSAELPSTPSLIRLDITNLLQAWLSGVFPNHGLVLVAKSHGEEFYYRSFVSSDHPDLSKRPRLQIELRTDH